MTAPAEVDCLVCRVPMRARELHGQPVHGCEKCHAVSLHWSSLRMAPREVSREIASATYQLRGDRCRCGQVLESAVLGQRPGRPEVTRCGRCSRYYFSAVAAKSLFARKADTSPGMIPPEATEAEVADGAPASLNDTIVEVDTWLNWLDIFDFFDD